MSRTTHRSTIRHRGSDDATPGTVVLGVKVSFDPTAASADTGKVLPKGAIPLGVDSLGGATGGTNPTVHVGTSGDEDGFADELDADGASFGGSGALSGVELTADTAIYGGVGASAATGGATTVIVQYIMADDGGIR